MNDSPQVQAPARTSLRSPAPSSVDHDHDLSSSDHLDGRDQLGADDNVQAVQGQHGHVSKRKEGKERKELWMKEHGDMLFDVFTGCPTGYVFTYLGTYTYLCQILGMLKVCIFLKMYVFPRILVN